MAHVKKQPSGCWEWQGDKNPKGYGRFFRKADGGRWPAHRYAYTMFVGPIPSGMRVLHKRGHEFTPANTMVRVDAKGRRCRICQRAARRASYARTGG